MQDKSDIDIIMGFLKDEIEGIGKYEYAIATIKSPEGKQLLKDIMGDEKKHGAALLKLANTVAQSTFK